MIYEFNGFKPVIDETAFVHPQAVITGNVIIGKHVYVGPGAALRGDWGQIIVHDGCNIQENCVIHMFPGLTVILQPQAHIGHGAIIHGATIGQNVLIGMNSVVMDHAVIGQECIVGALTFIPEGMIIPDRKLVAGNPGKIIKDVTDEMIAWKTRGTKLYQVLTTEMHQCWHPCEPLRQPEPDRPAQSEIYKTWKASHHENH
jgi:phenylacetic acid degradation protein/carnitine operon protein CaiE